MPGWRNVVLLLPVMNASNILLIPLSWLYGLGIWFRNLFYDLGIFRSNSFDVPVISVGNLSVGGTGKSPHIEYLIRLLSDKFRLATLSRGYGRKDKHYILATLESTADEIGDEPRQFKQKFEDLNVAVDTKRVRGIRALLEEYGELEAILLDDAYQHRAVKPGLSILLTDYSRLYCNDRLLPAGRLREPKRNASRADIIVVTKTPEVFSPLERRIIKNELRPKPHQNIFFSYLRYGDFVPFGANPESKRPNKEFYFARDFSILVITGIAHPESMIEYLESKASIVKHIQHPDHHPYSSSDIQEIKSIFDTFESGDKIILTTEKDAMRLQTAAFKDELSALPLFYLPIEVCFHAKDEEDFNNQITDYVGRNKINRKLHSA